MSQITDMLALVRSILNETSPGFYTDSELYSFINAGQDTAYQSLLQTQKQIRMVKTPDYESEALKSLLKITDVAISSGANSITIPTDTLEILQVELYRTPAHLVLEDKLLTTYLPISDFNKRLYNSFTGHRYDTVTNRGEVLTALSTGTTLITSFPDVIPSYWDKIRFRYYGKPTTISSIQNCTLPPTTYEAITELACYYAYLKYKDYGRANSHKQQGLIILQGL